MTHLPSGTKIFLSRTPNRLWTLHFKRIGHGKIELVSASKDLLPDKANDIFFISGVDPAPASTAEIPALPCVAMCDQWLPSLPPSTTSESSHISVRCHCSPRLIASLPADQCCAMIDALTGGGPPTDQLVASIRSAAGPKMCMTHEEMMMRWGTRPLLYKNVFCGISPTISIEAFKPSHARARFASLCEGPTSAFRICRLTTFTSWLLQLARSGP